MASVKSPDGTIQMTLRANGPLTYSVTVDGQVLLADSKLGLRFRDGVTLGANARLAKVERANSDSTWENPLGKRRTVRDHHQELRASFVEASGRPFQVIVRAFDDGIGFRYVLPATASAQTQEFVLEEEQTQFSFPGNFQCYAGVNENTGTKDNPIGYTGSQESEYKPTTLAELPSDQVRMLPLLVKSPAAWVAITESDLYDWAGMWVNRAADARQRLVGYAGCPLGAPARRQRLGQVGLPAPQPLAHSPHRPSARPLDRKRSGPQPGVALRAGRHLLGQARHCLLGLVVPTHAP